MSGDLSAREMLNAVKFACTEVPQRGGIKDYAPDGTWLQAKKVESFYREHRDALAEERVKKLGGTAMGEWHPDEGKVEVITTPGKFWTNMGHVVDQVKWLYPEESMLLLDQGLMEITYNSVPLTIQQGYCTLLGGGYPIERYQVYSHLKRLGFIVRRHDSISSTKYERQIGVDSNITKPPKKRKHKRKDNDGDLEIKKTKVDEELARDQSRDASPMSAEDEEADERVDDAADVKSQGFFPSWTVENNKPSRTPSVWNFSRLCFPDMSNLSLTDNSHHIHIPVPPPHLLPFSDMERHARFTVSRNSLLFSQHRETRAGALHFSFPVVKPKIVTKARNWRDYKAELSQLSQKEIMSSTPGSILWSEDDVKPLVSPEDATCTANILNKLKVIENVSSTISSEFSSCSFPVRNGLEIAYDVYLPNAKFRKTEPGFPDHRICVMRQEEEPPTLSEIAGLNQQCPDRVPLHWAVVDDGSPAFYRFADVDIPIDISKG